MKITTFALPLILIIAGCTRNASPPPLQNNPQSEKRSKIFLNLSKEWKSNKPHSMTIDDLRIRIGKEDFINESNGQLTYVWKSEGKLILCATTKKMEDVIIAINCVDTY